MYKVKVFKDKYKVVALLAQACFSSFPLNIKGDRVRVVRAKGRSPLSSPTFTKASRIILSPNPLLWLKF